MDDVRREYRTALTDLTFNSRPIIQNLTTIAQENLPSAPAIVQAIDDHFRNAVPRQKLPILYLIDSICKNVGNAYIGLFSRVIVNSFVAAFSVVDPEDKGRFMKVLETWRTHPTGQVFITAIINEIEERIRRPPPRPDSSFSRHPGPGPGLPPRGFASGYPNRPPPNQYPPPPRPHGPSWNPPPRDMGPGPGPGPVPKRLKENLAINQPIYTHSTLQPNLHLQQQIQGLLKQANQNLTLNPTDPATVNQVSILSKLLELVSSTALDAAAQDAISQQLKVLNFAAPPPPNQLNTFVAVASDPNVPADGSLSSVRALALNRAPKISLSKDDLSRKYPGLAQILLHDILELQCKQCGLRYFKSKEGQAKMQTHLDWHFRQNRRAKDQGRKAFSREWYVSADDWVAERETDGKEATVPTFFFDGNEAQSAESEAPKEIPNISVTEDNVGPCAICNEEFEKFWDEDKEEWMIKNAIQQDGKVYHFTCLEDMNRNNVTKSGDSVLGKRKPE
ncbi:hypothetical protein HDU97_002633 [Phlyctochytrium planicorne]|nr:hypothetical protein HDU97_002633 [Phlyctochytrium planicorne]